MLSFPLAPHTPMLSEVEQRRLFRNVEEQMHSGTPFENFYFGDVPELIPGLNYDEAFMVLRSRTQGLNICYECYNHIEMSKDSSMIAYCANCTVSEIMEVLLDRVFVFIDLGVF